MNQNEYSLDCWDLWVLLISGSAVLWPKGHCGMCGWDKFSVIFLLWLAFVQTSRIYGCRKLVWLGIFWSCPWNLDSRKTGVFRQLWVCNCRRLQEGARGPQGKHALVWFSLFCLVTLSWTTNRPAMHGCYNCLSVGHSNAGWTQKIAHGGSRLILRNNPEADWLWPIFWTLLSWPNLVTTLPQTELDYGWGFNHILTSQEDHMKRNQPEKSHFRF